MALLEDYRNDFVACHRCVFCKFIPMEKIKSLKHSDVCPSITKYNINAYSGGGKLSMGFALLDGRLQYTDKMLHAINNCNMCGACDVSCKYNIDMELLEPLYEIRNQSVEDGHTVPALDKVIANLKKTNSMVEFKNKRGDWAEGLGVKDASKEKTDVLYFAGCQTSYNKNLQKLAKATVKILQNAGVDFGILGDAEMCCAGRAYQMGYQSDFLTEAKKNVALFKKAKVKTIVTGCGDCYHAFKVLYDKFDLKGGLEVLHITEYIDRLIKEGKLKPKKKVDLNVTYHDPCHLGRQGEPWIHWKGKELPGPHRIFEPTKEFRRGTHGIYEPPRDILKSIPGLKLVEMDRIKEYAWCCGAGGGVSDSNPEFSMWTAKERIEEAISTGAEAIVTACPWCEQNFTNAIKEMGSNLKVYDVVELL